MTNNKLIHKDFPFTAFAFEKEKNGKAYTIYSISRAYKDKNKEWQHQSISLFPEELLKTCEYLYANLQFTYNKAKCKYW